MKAKVLARVSQMSHWELAEVAFEFAERFPDLFEAIVLPDKTETFTVPFVPGKTIDLKEEDVQTLRNFNYEDKVKAIKLVRDRVPSLALREAKDFVEAHFTNVLRPDPPHAHAYEPFDPIRGY